MLAGKQKKNNASVALKRCIIFIDTSKNKAFFEMQTQYRQIM